MLPKKNTSLYIDCERGVRGGGGGGSPTEPAVTCCGGHPGATQRDDTVILSACISIGICQSAVLAL